MAFGMSTNLRNDRLQKIIDRIDAGGGQGKIKIYDGTRPATGGSGTTLLATLRFTAPPSAPAPSGGVLTFSTISPDTNAAASGTATWARLTDSADNFVMDMSVGAAGSGADLELINTTITAGGTVSINSGSITEANA